MAIPLGRRLPAGSCGLPEGLAGGQPIPSARPCSGWGLSSRWSHLQRWCALTAPFHPYLCGPRPKGPGAAIGGLFSVALSCGSPRLGVTQRPALWSPDVPRPGYLSGPDAAIRPTRHQRHCRGSRPPVSPPTAQLGAVPGRLWVEGDAGSEPAHTGGCSHGIHQVAGGWPL